MFSMRENSKNAQLLQILQQFQVEGGREVERLVEHYNLDVIISVGYRVKSQQGVVFGNGYVRSQGVRCQRFRAR